MARRVSSSSSSISHPASTSSPALTPTHVPASPSPAFTYTPSTSPSPRPSPYPSPLPIGTPTSDDEFTTKHSPNISNQAAGSGTGMNTSPSGRSGGRERRRRRGSSAAGGDPFDLELPGISMGASTSAGSSLRVRSIQREDEVQKEAGKVVAMDKPRQMSVSVEGKETEASNREDAGSANDEKRARRRTRIIGLEAITASFPSVPSPTIDSTNPSSPPVVRTTFPQPLSSPPITVGQSGSPRVLDPESSNIISNSELSNDDHTSPKAEYQVSSSHSPPIRSPSQAHFGDEEDVGRRRSRSRSSRRRTAVIVGGELQLEELAALGGGTSPVPPSPNPATQSSSPPLSSPLPSLSTPVSAGFEQNKENGTPDSAKAKLIPRSNVRSESSDNPENKVQTPGQHDGKHGTVVQPSLVLPHSQQLTTAKPALAPPNPADADAEVSSLYDRASLHSTRTSSSSYSVAHDGEGTSTLYGMSADDSTRFSTMFGSEEDGGLGMGIGLTMLTDLADEESEEGGIENKADDEAVGKSDSLHEVDSSIVPLTPRSFAIAKEEVPVIDPQNSTQQGTVSRSLPMPDPAAPRSDSEHESSAGHDVITEARDEDGEVDIDRGSKVESASEDEDEDWDGAADIYDNYRYSRYSMMSKASRRKSRQSVLSAHTFPIPGTDVPEADGLEARKSPALQGQRRHVPPPLDLAQPGAVPTRSSSELTPTPTQRSSGSSPQGPLVTSPLLHTNFPSPPGNLGFGAPSPALSMASFSGMQSIDNAAGGIASALRQKLESGRVTSSATSPVIHEGPASTEGKVEGNEIVVEDDESMHVAVVPIHDQTGDDIEVDIDLTRGSIQTAKSESTGSETASVSSDVSKEMRKIEEDIVSALQSPDSASRPAASSSIAQSNDPRTPTSADFPLTPTQPLRLHDRPAQRSGPSSEQEKNPASPPPSQITRPILHQSQPQTQQEPTLFLPHPNAPRPNPAVVSGQRTSMYGMPPVHVSHPQATQPQNSVSAHNSLHSTLRMAAAARMGPSGIPRMTTIFGRTIEDLASAVGPVPMVWSLDPFPPENNGRPIPPGRHLPRRAATAGASPLSISVNASAPEPVNVRSPPPPLSPVPGSPLGLKDPVRPKDGEQRSSRTIPRANFFPQVGKPRPRSRSFSGYGNDSPAMPPPNAARSSEEERKPSRVASMQSLREAAVSSGNGSSASGQSSQHTSVSSPSSIRSSHTPSPLSLPQNNVRGGPRSPANIKAPPSPLGRPPILSDRSTTPQSDISSSSGPSAKQQLKGLLEVHQASSGASIKSDRPISPLVGLSATAAPRNAAPPAALPSAPTLASSQSTSTITSTMERLRRISTSSSKKHKRTLSQQSRSSSNSDVRSTMASPPLVGENTGPRRSNSLKSKLSLPSLRVRNGMQTPSPTTASATPVTELDQPETVHVQDAEFEMIRPTIRRMSSEATSIDSLQQSGERSGPQSDTRSSSPAGVSLKSIGTSRSPIPIASSESPEDIRSGSKSVEGASSIEAHRARELKWMATMTSVPASQARKSKKIRRLILEGVPSSVRFLVWSHLTDSKAKRTPGVYAQLGKRGRVAATGLIERDAQRCFPDQPHLQDPKGPLVCLLQAYLNMVPDVEYHTSMFFSFDFPYRLFIHKNRLGGNCRAYFASVSGGRCFLDIYVYDGLALTCLFLCQICSVRGRCIHLQQSC